MTEEPSIVRGEGVARWYSLVMEALAALSMLIIVVVMAIQVFFRYGLNASLIWAEELCRYVLIWMSFLFVGVAFQRGEFVAIDFVANALPQTWRLVLKVLVTLPALFFLWLLVENGYLYAARFRAQTLPALDFIWTSLSGRPAGISIFWVYISVSVGCALLMIHMVLALVFEAVALRRERRRPGAVPPLR